MRPHRGSHWKATLIGAGALGLALSSAAWAGLTVGPARAATGASAPTVGTIPDSAWGPGGQVDLSQVPDFVPALSDGRVVGYVSKTQLFPSTPVASPDRSQATTGLSTYHAPTATDQAAANAKLVKTVYASNLTTVVGHMYPGIGFVPDGQTPPAMPSSPPTTVAGDGSPTS